MDHYESSTDVEGRRPSDVTQGSAVQRLLTAIRSEREAAQRGLTGYAQVSRHAFIEQRQENIAAHFEALAEVLGDKDRAIVLVVEAMNAGDTHAAP